MKQPRAAPCGTWTSGLTAQVVAAASLRLGNIVVDGDEIYWLEGRPQEKGRSVLVKRCVDGTITEVSPATANVRTRVQEYGGSAYIVSGGVVCYSEFSDQRLYRLKPGGRPAAITPSGAWCFADATVDPDRPRLVCVREDHGTPGREAVTTLVSVPLDGEPTAGEVIVSGHDFYAAPRFCRDGTRLSWLAWRHPQMPWDGTELWVADVAADGTLESPRLIAGGADESIFQPGWAADGTLYFVSDRSGWWNLYCARGDGVQAVCPMDAECGRPMWQLGTSTWAFAGPSRVVVAHARKGRWRLGTVDLSSERAGVLEVIQTDIEPGESVAATSTHAVVLGGGAGRPDAILRIDLATGASETLRSTCELSLEPRFLSEPRPIEFPTDGNLTAHAFFYAPASGDFNVPTEERPPLLVICHGGPTAAANARLNLEVQYWTTRGFAVVDVNYGGSASYGRAYRRRLNGQWGVVDVADAANAARYLVRQGQADAARVAIRGRSAGGYTTLAGLVFESSTFTAGASYYGIGDLERLAQDTHKFESRYLDGLIGPYPVARDLYRSRSPIHHLDRLASPLILFQGLEDRVVPPNQAQLMADAVRSKGVPVALLTFAGEQHGFRRAETIVACLEAELSFYGAVFGFVAPDTRPLDIANLDRSRSR